MRLYIWISLVLSLLVISVSLKIVFAHQQHEIRDRFHLLRSRASTEDQYAASEFHRRLVSKWSLPAISEPQFEQTSASISGEDTVIGILVDGQAVAFPVTEMSSPSNHLVQFNLGETNLTVTHCNLSGCSRVFQDDPSSPAESPELRSPALRMGGLQEDGKMVLMLDQVRYTQDSMKIPLEDYEFQVMPFSHWDCEHPNTLLYTGEKEIRHSMAP